MESEFVEKNGYEDYCLEILLQNLQVNKQQSLNLKFARPSNFSEGELSAYNTVIRQIESMIDLRNEYWKNFRDPAETFPQRPN